MLSGHHGATRTCAHRPLKARSSWYRQSQPVGASTRLPRRAKCLRRDQLSSLRFWQSYLQWWAARPPKNALRAPSIAVTIPSGLQVTRAKRGPGTAVTGDALRMSRYKRAFSSFVRAAHCHARSATLRETRRVSDASKRVQNRAPVRKDRACGARIHDGLGEPERGYTRIRGALLAVVGQRARVDRRQVIAEVGSPTELLASKGKRTERFLGGSGLERAHRSRRRPRRAAP